MKRATLPPELRGVPVDVLENYVGSQIAIFANGLAHRLGQHGYHVPGDLYKAAARDVFQLMTSENQPAAAPQDRDLQLVFRHDCQALGCLISSCKLCKHNPNRRCAVNFEKKYLVNDVLKAKCQAVIRVEIVDCSTNQPLDEDFGKDILLQMAVLDGNAYDAKLEAGRDLEFDVCTLLVNNKGAPLLVGTAVANDPRGFVMVPLTRSKAVLPELRVTDSSEAMLSGRKPPLRLMMRAVYKSTLEPVPHIRHAISEGFVVATRRTRTAGKADIPSVDDHVSKLEHMGKETVKKLCDVLDAARQAGIDDFELPQFQGPVVCIDTVGSFRQLALCADQDTHLRQKLQQILKLSKEKWDEARDHAMKAVVIDNRMRVWWNDDLQRTGQMQARIGMVFLCLKGTVDVERPAALMQEGGEPLFASSWTPQQHELVCQLQPMAQAQWWQAGHPNWDMLEWDSETYTEEGTLVRAKLADASDPSVAEDSRSRPVSMAGAAPRANPSANGGLHSGSLHSASRGGGRGDASDRGLPSPQALLSSTTAADGARGGGGSAGVPESAFSRDDPSRTSTHLAGGLNSAFDDGSLQGPHAGMARPPAAGMSAHGGEMMHGQGRMGPPPPPGAPLTQLRSDDILDMIPSMNTMPFGSIDMLRGSVDIAGVANRLISGMDTATEEWMNGQLAQLQGGLGMSRNPSGLDTMQSIENALPEDR